MGVILVRGLPGSGKTTVRDHLCSRLDAMPLSTDIVRQNLQFLDVYQQGESFKNDETTVAKSATAYAAMLAIASERTPEDVRRRFSQWCSYAPTGREYDDLYSYVERVMAQRKPLVICEAPFTPERLSFALDVLSPSPVLLEVIADKTRIPQFIHDREGAAGESRAGTGIYRTMLEGWRTLRQLRKHRHLIPNTGSKDDLNAAADRAMGYARRCSQCKHVLR